MRQPAERWNKHTKLLDGRYDRPIAELATRQHGVVSVQQLLALGLSQSQITYRVKVGRLFKVHRGVYAVGRPELERRGRWMAAILLAPGSLLSGRSAAELLRLRRPTGGEIHVTAARQVRARGPIRFRQSAVPADERTEVDDIPSTGLSRTLFDLAAAEGRGALLRAMREAHFRQLTDLVSLPELLDRYPARPGSRAVRAVLASRAYTLRTRSDLEDDFIDFLVERGLPLPAETNAILEVEGERFEVDCLYRAERLVIEIDDHSTHGTPEAMEKDRRCDGLLSTQGWPVQRITDRRLTRHRDELERQLRAGLGLRPPTSRKME